MARNSREDGYPLGGGEMGALVRGLDWAKTSLGPISAWPARLKATISLMLPAQAQIVLFWGPEFVALYNDAYAPTIGDKHPRALGRPARENWTELWDDLEPLLRRVLETGETVRQGPPLLHRAARLPRERVLRHLLFSCSGRGRQVGASSAL